MDAAPSHSARPSFDQPTTNPAPNGPPPTPSDALEQIEALDPEFPADGWVGQVPGAYDRLRTAHLEQYNKQRADIADRALAAAPPPPQREDFQGPGLNAATADHEYRTALAEHNRQIGELKRISAEAKAFPTKSPEEGHRLYQAIESIKSLAPRAADDPAAARALADQIIGLKGDPAELKLALDQAFKGMSTEKLNATVEQIVNAGVKTTSEPNPMLRATEHSVPANIVTYDATGLKEVLNAVAVSGDPRTKAAFFKEAAAEAREIELECRGDNLENDWEQGNSLEQIREGMGKIINSDAAPVIKSLRQDVDPKGEGLQTYLRAIVLAGKEEISVDAGRQLALSLKAGDASPADLGYFLANLRVTAEELKPSNKVDDYAVTALAIGVGFANGWAGAAISVGGLLLNEVNGEDRASKLLDRSVGLISESLVPITVDQQFIEAKKQVFRLNGMDEYTPTF